MRGPCVSPHFCTQALCATVPDEKPGTVKPGLSVIIPPLNSRRQRSGYTALGDALHSCRVASPSQSRPRLTVEMCDNGKPHPARGGYWDYRRFSRRGISH